MPIMIRVASGLMDGLGISLFSKRDMVLWAARFFTGVAVAWALYMRVRDENKAEVKAETVSGERWGLSFGAVGYAGLDTERRRTKPKRQMLGI